MGVTAAIAAAVLALVAMVAAAARQRGQRAPLAWLLAPVALGCSVGWALVIVRFLTGSAEVLRALSVAAWASAAVLCGAVLVVGVRVPEAAPRRPALSVWTLSVGLLGVALLIGFWRDDGLVLASAVPATALVVTAWRAARALEAKANRGAARAAFDLVLAICLAYGAVACSAIGATCAALTESTAHFESVSLALGRAASFAVPPTAAGAVALSRRLTLLGHGAVGRGMDFVGVAALVVVVAAPLRLVLAREVDERTTYVMYPSPEPTVSAVASEGAVPDGSAPERPALEGDASVVVGDAGAADALDAASDSASAAPAVFDGGVAIQVTKVNGMLAPVEVSRGVEKVRPFVEKCRADSPGSSGQVTVRFIIGSEGSVSNIIEDDAATLTDRKLVQCIQSAFYKVGFATPTYGSVRVEVPIRIE